MSNYRDGLLALRQRIAARRGDLERTARRLAAERIERSLESVLQETLDELEALGALSEQRQRLDAATLHRLAAGYDTCERVLDGLVQLVRRDTLNSRVELANQARARRASGLPQVAQQLEPISLPTKPFRSEPLSDQQRQLEQDALAMLERASERRRARARSTAPARPNLAEPAGAGVSAPPTHRNGGAPPTVIVAAQPATASPPIARDTEPPPTARELRELLRSLDAEAWAPRACREAAGLDQLGLTAPALHQEPTLLQHGVRRGIAGELRGDTIAMRVWRFFEAMTGDERSDLDQTVLLATVGDLPWLSLRPQGFFAKLFTRELELGDPSFDELFLIRSDRDAAAVSELLSPAIRAGLCTIAEVDVPTLLVEDGQATLSWHGQAYPVLIEAAAQVLAALAQASNIGRGGCSLDQGLEFDAP
jgi:hypothetical protein